MMARSYPHVLLLMVMMIIISHNQIASILFDQFIVRPKSTCHIINDVESHSFFFRSFFSGSNIVNYSYRTNAHGA